MVVEGVLSGFDFVGLETGGGVGAVLLGGLCAEGLVCSISVVVVAARSASPISISSSSSSPSSSSSSSSSSSLLSDFVPESFRRLGL